MGWIRIAGKSLEFTGKIVQSASFEDWALSKGEQIVNEFAQKRTIAFFGKKKAAKKEIWQDLVNVSRKPALFAVINDLAKSYERTILLVANAVQSNQYLADGHTYAVPTTAVNSLHRAIVESRLSKSDEFRELKGGAELQSFFYDEFVAQLDSAFQLLRPSASDPLKLSDSWYAVGSNVDYDWRYTNETWKGYLFLHGRSSHYVEPSKDRNRLEKIAKQITSLELTLGTFSKEEKLAFVAEWIRVRDRILSGEKVSDAPALVQ
ncbi:hypothetical protein CO669_31660 [Bradyrhizobium sp. Y36]|uniref:hypothetical protein n=1 Tax=Bradyrhizobium sp. Y36 TaxID=2035447 RepID=UPI000BEA991A|nr:hypothetical protein [Bradyrhizobium sp. Y36]PDT85118.1 hypothetical protein CO669_31660 [Bradyrhizobium sp. Y36]